jgi:hypothetical protein
MIALDKQKVIARAMKMAKGKLRKKLTHSLFPPSYSRL